MAVAEVFRALGDPVRLEMVQRLTRREAATISVVSEGLGITRQGARKHLQVLADSGVVRLEPHGREVAVRLDAERLESARIFIEEMERRWDTRLDALKRFVEEEGGQNG
ncbi:MAG TPA: helix-turn-helix domain-containing protein [Fimbriimonadaceae bacterium]|nr:helix-turn-helix domain-containing protein [Fimbriimonadaceae bacterium]